MSDPDTPPTEQTKLDNGPMHWTRDAATSPEKPDSPVFLHWVTLRYKISVMAGRPRLHPNQAEKQFAYRQRQRAQRDDEREQIAAWQRVRAAATASGILSGDETEFEAAQIIIRRGT